MFGIIAVLVWGFVLLVHGFVPGGSQTPLTALFGTGWIQCLHDQGVSSLWTWCMSLGLPVGAPRMTGQPEIYLGWLLSYLPGVDAWAAHQITKGALDTAALVGAYLLLRRFGVLRGVALAAAASFMLAPNVLVLNGFPYTFIGYLMLPAASWATLRALDLFESGRWPGGVAVLVPVSLLMVFTDGYAYFSWVLVAGMLALGWAVRAWHLHSRRTAVVGLTTALACVAGAAVVYAAWVPGNAYETPVPLEYFGLLGVDVVTLFVPSAFFLFPRLFGIDPPALDTWGITDTAPTNYLGYLTLALAVVGIVLAGRRRGDARRGELLMLAVAGVVALILSLGPTLKVGQTEPGLAESLLTLPTSWLYESAPGLSDMRATNRWLIVTRFVCIALAAVGLTALWSRWRTPVARVVVVVIGMLLVVETAPNLWRQFDAREDSIQKVAYLRDGIVVEADEMLEDDELVLVLPSINDFLASYLVPMVGVRSFNVGGDKNYYLSTAQWPVELLAARDNYGAIGDATYFCRALDGPLETIVLPYMSPYLGPLLVEEEPEAIQQRKELALRMAADPRFDAEVGEWLTVLRRGTVGCEVE